MRPSPWLGIVPRLALLVFAAISLGSGCATSRTTAAHRPPADDAGVRAVLEQQVREWNDGRIDRFMETYARSDTTRFASGGDVTLGWDTVLERYRSRYPDRAAMGQLAFRDLDVQMLSSTAALAFGRWQLTREGDAPQGLFSLVLRLTPEGWRIVHDHTSSAAP